LKCQYCGLDVSLPFRCPFCGKYFCVEHRLPELHNCQGVRRASMAHWASLGEPILKEDSMRVHNKPKLSFKISGRLLRFTEIIHLTIGTLLVISVGLSIAIEGSFPADPFLILLLALIFSSAFILHELCHKFVAKIYGLWAEFRLTLLGIIITLISIFSPIKIVSPGTVIVSGEANKEIIGKTSLSGPLVNLMLFLTFFVSSLLIGTFSLKTAFIWGSLINAFVALLNLIPFGFLDGAKVFWWNKYVWFLVFIASLLSTITALKVFLYG